MKTADLFIFFFLNLDYQSIYQYMYIHVSFLYFYPIAYYRVRPNTACIKKEKVYFMF